jgi:hypothetical protein
VSEIVRWFAHADVTNNRLRIQSEMHETMRRAFRHDSLPIVSGDDAGDVTVDLASHLSTWLLREDSPIALWIFMRCSAASTLSAALRPCVPHGPRALTPPALRSNRALTRWSRFRSLVDSTHHEAYVRSISLVPARHSSTSSDVERFGMTLEGFVPTAS